MQDKTRPDAGPNPRAAASFPPGMPVPLARRSPTSGAATRLAVAVPLLALLWAALTDWRLDAWVFGLPAVLVGGAVVLMLPAAPAWRIAPMAALRFACWFALHAVRGALDVARCAVLPRMPLDPGFRAWRTALPEGAPRILLANAVTLLPGTLTAELEGRRLVVHLLDCAVDLDSELTALERRVAAVFALDPDLMEVRP